MNKKAAQKTIDAGDLTFGALKKAISDNRGTSGMSAVNKQFTKEQVLDIYEAGIADRDDDQIIEPWTYSPIRNRDVRTKDFLIAVNIVRDCM